MEVRDVLRGLGVSWSKVQLCFWQVRLQEPAGQILGLGLEPLRLGSGKNFYLRHGWKLYCSGKVYRVRATISKFCSHVVEAL